MYGVSVVIAAYNAKTFISDAINSVLEQTYSDWELIIIDDCSTDGTAAYVESSYTGMARIKCLALDRNSGPSAARNLGIRVARGKWIAILDSDDKFLPHRLETLVGACESETLDLVADNQLYQQDGNAAVFQRAFTLADRQIALNPELLLRNDGPPLRFSFGSLKPVLRRQFLLDHDLQYPEHLRIGEDFAFLFKCLNCGAKARLLAEQLYIYTVPKTRARPLSAKTRTNYGKGNIESLIHGNRELQQQMIPQHLSPSVDALFERRDQRLSCALALRDVAALPVSQAASRLWRESWGRFFIDKVRNVFQRSHSVRGAQGRAG